MSLSPGSRLGPYEITGAIGAGGMGEVFRARDTKLDRDVAIKVLPAVFAQDRERLARFEREAKLLASLNHPNIAHVYGFEASPLPDGTTAHFLAMELVEGEDLAERLKRGAIPVDEAIAIAKQIAEGLEEAHEHGVIHRDLKPANVRVTQDGKVKILDFGLAKAYEATSSSSAPDLSHSPTISRHMTEAGIIMGTAAYMSPEQARGKKLDRRGDIWSFGVLLFEILSGTRLFAGETVSDTLASVLRQDVTWTALPSATPPRVKRLLERCLDRDVKQRLRDIGEARFELERIERGERDVTTQASAMTAGQALAIPASVRPEWWRRALPLAWLVAGGLVGALAMRWLGAPVPAEPPRTRPLTFSGKDRDPAASPDGRLVAFASSRDGVSRIWIKQLQGGGEAPLTAGPDRAPRFSPDGSSVLFIRTEGAVRSAYRIGLVGGEPRKLVDDAYMADWLPDGATIAFARLRVPQPAGGAAEPGRLASLVGVRELASGRERILYSPEDRAISSLRVSPDGRTLGLIEGPFVLNTRFELILIDVASGSARRATEPGNPLGCMVWSGVERMALARAGSPLGDGSGGPSRVFLFDPARRSERTLFYASGLFPLAGSDSRSAICDGLGSGQLVFDQVEWRMNLSEVGLSGSSGTPRPLTSGNSRDRQPAYSPDAGRIVFSSNRSGNMDLWMLETRTGALRQLTDDPAQDWDPGFTPDGKHVLWSSDRSGHLEIWMAGTDGSGARQVTRDGVDAENPTATPDGRFVVYASGNAERLGVWRIRPDGSEDRQIVAGAALVPEISPDGRKVLLVTGDRDGQRVIRVADIETGALVPFQIEVTWPPSASNQVLHGRARWTPDGRRIAFIGANAEGHSGVFLQDYARGRDTSATRRAVAGFAADSITESLGVSPDGKSLVISTLYEYSSLTLAEGLAGFEPRKR